MIYYQHESSLLPARLIDYEIKDKKWFANIIVNGKIIKTPAVNLKSEEYAKLKEKDELQTIQ